MINIQIQKLPYYTVGDLLEFIQKNDIPLTAKIFVERIEDFYFTNCKWKSIEKISDELKISQYSEVNSSIKYNDSKDLFLDLDKYNNKEITC
jgi:hypothetical protein